MKTINNLSAQGDVMFRRVSGVPANAMPQVVVDGRAVVAHSETGHDHVAHGPGLAFYETADPLVCYLRCEGPIQVDHLRDDHTHEAHELAPGAWACLRQREYAPEASRRVED